MKKYIFVFWAKKEKEYNPGINDIYARKNDVKFSTMPSKWGLIDNKRYYCLHYREKNMDTAWIGLSDQKIEGTFEWYINHNSRYTSWHIGQPNGSSGSNEDCVNIFKDNEGWSDYFCDYKMPYICEIP